MECRHGTLGRLREHACTGGEGGGVKPLEPASGVADGSGALLHVGESLSEVIQIGDGGGCGDEMWEWMIVNVVCDAGEGQANV